MQKKKTNVEENINVINNKGISLVALVVTIIIVLIIVCVSFYLALVKSGIKINTKKFDEESLKLHSIDIKELAEDVKDREMAKMKLQINVDSDKAEINLPIHIESNNNNKSNYKYDCIVDWGDGSKLQKVKQSKKIKDVIHKYNSEGTYTITIDGVYESLYVKWGSNIQDSLIKVEQWGNMGLKEVKLKGCKYFNEIAEPSRSSFSKMKNFDYSFSFCESLENIPEKIFANCIKVKSFKNTFRNCEGLIYIWKII